MDRTATGVCFCPTTERDLGDGIGPAPALLAGRGLFSLGSDSHAVIDLFEEARAVELDERLAPASAESSPRPPARRRDRRRAARPRLDGGGRARGRRARRPRRRRHRSIRTAGGGATVENVVFAASAADVTDVIVDGRPWWPTATRHRAGRRVTRTRPWTMDVGGGADDRSLRQHRRAGDQRRDTGRRFRSASSTTRRWSSTATASPGSGRRADAPDAEERVDCGNQRDTGIRRQPCPPGLRRGPIGRVRRADERRSRTTAAESRRRCRRPAPPTTRAVGQPARLAGELFAKWRHHFREQERIRPDRRR